MFGDESESSNRHLLALSDVTAPEFEFECGKKLGLENDDAVTDDETDSEWEEVHSFVRLLLDKKRKKKKKKMVAIRESFFPCKWSVFWFSRKFFMRNSSKKLLFAKVFVKNFAIFWSRESFCL